MITTIYQSKLWLSVKIVTSLSYWGYSGLTCNHERLTTNSNVVCGPDGSLGGVTIQKFSGNQQKHLILISFYSEDFSIMGNLHILKLLHDSSAV